MRLYDEPVVAQYSPVLYKTVKVVSIASSAILPYMVLTILARLTACRLHLALQLRKCSPQT
jgi:hypothetical protein